MSCRLSLQSDGHRFTRKCSFSRSHQASAFKFLRVTRASTWLCHSYMQAGIFALGTEAGVFSCGRRCDSYTASRAFLESWAPELRTLGPKTGDWYPKIRFDGPSEETLLLRSFHVSPRTCCQIQQSQNAKTAEVDLFISFGQGVLPKPLQGLESSKEGLEIR